MFENGAQAFIEKKQKIMFEHLFLSLNFSYFLAKFPPLHDLNARYITTGRPAA